ncbi:hypothetical protein HXA34_13310 [Salipaludibacillus agaradhaerens]|uniref:hypothetical protein n=1 Tax=Salipaludibacillus agaradhaerens TaxID=76935 RepID=UPI002151854B|nr:hypothetical protein [Salipaludibacillus agaradhaerens]MCR6107277.1 hypothetical protein [Salipaludibacillus agaradhaerens]MCR6119306.1 hypothetical protein [Salipaludibacillus agaradhaerens]UJW58344.1 hypothetical protein HXZ66_13435 [Bacillus sp. A116_S68]
MYKVNPDLKEMMNLQEASDNQLKEKYNSLVEELSFARSAYEFENTAEIKMQMVYIIQELKERQRKREIELQLAK